MDIKRIGAILIVFFAVLLTATSTHASEGDATLLSTNNERYWCWVPSVQMMDLKYTILVTCRNLIYPAGDDIFSYVLWATPLDGSKPLRLGELGLGRAQFKSGEPFSNLFVTTEANPKTRTPTGPIVMSGTMQRIPIPQGLEFFDEENIELPQEVVQATLTPTPKGSALLRGLRSAGVAIVLGIVAVIGLVFVLTRSKR